MSISKGNQPKMKRTTTTTNLSTNQQSKKKKSNDIQTFKPHYSQVSDVIFKQMLSNAIEHSDQLVACLNTEEKL